MNLTTHPKDQDHRNMMCGWPQWSTEHREADFQSLLLELVGCWHKQYSSHLQKEKQLRYDIHDLDSSSGTHSKQICLSAQQLLWWTWMKASRFCWMSLERATKIWNQPWFAVLKENIALVVKLDCDCFKFWAGLSTVRLEIPIESNSLIGN